MCERLHCTPVVLQPVEEGLVSDRVQFTLLLRTQCVAYGDEELETIVHLPGAQQVQQVAVDVASHRRQVRRAPDESAEHLVVGVLPETEGAVELQPQRADVQHALGVRDQQLQALRRALLRGHAYWGHIQVVLGKRVGTVMQKLLNDVKGLLSGC